MDIGALIDSNPLVVVFVIIATPFLVLAAVLAFLAIQSHRRAQASKDWPTARATILSSQVTKEKGSSTPRTYYYYARINYEYKVKGKRYTSRRVDAGLTMGGSQREAQVIIDRYPEQSVQTVYYDPNNPSMGILERGTGKTIRVMTWGVAFILFMMGITAAALFGLSGPMQ